MTKEDRINEYLKLAEPYLDENGNSFLTDEKLMNYLKEGGFFTAPASTKYHGAYEGGLYDHSKQVFLRLAVLTDKNGLKWQRKESPFIIGMFHDLCKCDQYIENDTAGEVHYEYNKNTLLKGHGTKSIMLLSHLMELTEEEMLCIRFHMGPYGNEQEQKDEWAGFDAAIRRYPNTYWTHAADMIASKIDGI